MSYPSCEECNTSFVKKTAICSKCLWGIPLCSSCDSFWKSKSCPKCNTGFANWKFV